MKLTNALSIDQEIDSNLVYLQHVADAKWEVARFENDPFDVVERVTNAARDAARMNRVIKSAEMRRYDALSTTYEKTEALRDVLEEMAGPTERPRYTLGPRPALQKVTAQLLMLI